MITESDTALASQGPGLSRACRFAQILVVIVATTLHGIFLSEAKPLQSANDRSRWCAAWSLVERGTFQIDEIRQRPGWETIDMIRVDDHYYSTKPPLFTIVVAGIVWCVKLITGWNLLNQTQSVTFIVLIVVNLIPFFLSLLAWVWILDLAASTDWTRVFVLTIAAGATLVTPFLMTLNNHTVATASTSFALYALLRILKSDEGQSPTWAFVLCGLMTGWTIVNELPAAALGLFVFILLCRVSARSTAVFFVPAALIPIVALIVSNLIATGSWKPAYASYGSDRYRFVIDGIPSYWMHPHGIDQNLDSPAVYFLHCLIGHHGIFSLTPVVILALVGWIFSFKFQDRVMRNLTWVSAATTAIVIGFYLTRTQNYNYGGVSCGLRWAIWLTPLWLMAMIPVLDATANSRFARSVAVVLGIVSAYSAWQPIENPWRHPWLFTWMEAHGWIDYSDKVPTLDRPLWTWFASLPEKGVPAWVEFSVAQPGIAPRIVRITGQYVTVEGGEELLEMEVRESVDDARSPIKVRKLLLEVTKYQKGLPPAEFLRWTDPNVTPMQQQSDLAFVRGLPSKVPYGARAIRYLKTVLRKDAFNCVLSTARVDFEATDGGPQLSYHCQTWLTDEVPFGTAQVDWQVNSSGSSEILFRERWTLRDCSPKPPAQFRQRSP